MRTKQIAIIGGGPIGLEAALYARALGHAVVVYERGDVAESVKSWGFVRLFSAWEMNATPLGWNTLAAPAPSGECPTGEELCQRYLLPLAASQSLESALRTHTTVISIGRDDFQKSDAIAKPDRGNSPFRMLVRDDSGAERIDRAEVVLDCSGTYTHHRWSGRGGIPAPGERALEREGRIRYTLPDILGRDRARFVGRHTLVLGAGYSAATALLNLEQLYQEDRATKVTWATRRVSQAMQAIHGDPLPARARLVEFSIALADHPPPWLQYLGNCVLEQVDANGGGGGGKIGVTLHNPYMKTDLALAVDELIALVGYAPDTSIYEQLQVHQCYATAGPMKTAAALMSAGAGGADCMTAGEAIGPDALKNPEPSFFILGAKSFGTNSSFLLQTGHKQVRDCFRLIQNDAALDLYRS